MIYSENKYLIMAADPLSILFGSTARVKLLRFFLFNPSKEFLFDDISRRAKLVRRTARTEISALEKAGVIKQKTVYMEVEGKAKKMKAIGYTLNKDFLELQALQTFLFETAPIDAKNLLKHLRQAGVLDFVGISGVFVRDFEQRIDVLLAMKKFSQSKVEKAIRALEAEIGMEIRFAAMSSEDLMYRVGMYDKLTRDFFDYPNQVLIDKIGVKDEVTANSY
jgi:DNA-binding Lrp family transcriptional regulator